MKQCKSWEKLIEKLVAGSITESENARLEAHLKTCASCRELVRMHHALENSVLKTPAVKEEEFFRMRQETLRIIRNRQSSVVNWALLWQNIKLTLAHPATGYVTAILLCGILVFNNLDEESITVSKVDNQLIQSINQVAAQNTSLTEVQNSPYTYRNVSMRDKADGRVQLSFDVSTHIVTEVEQNDPLLHEILAQSLVSNESVGNQLQAIKYSQNVLDNKIQQALIYTILNDQNPAVRLKAMNALNPVKNDKTVRDVMLKVLKNETMVQMRLLAIDYLTQDQTGRDLVREELSESDTPVNPALLIRADQNLQLQNNKEK